MSDVARIADELPDNVRRFIVSVSEPFWPAVPETRRILLSEHLVRITGHNRMRWNDLGLAVRKHLEGKALAHTESGNG